MILKHVTAASVAAILSSLLVLGGCQESGSDKSGVSRKDIKDVASILSDTAGAMNQRPETKELAPRIVFTKQDIPNEGGYLQVSIGDITDDQANRFMRRLKSEPCTCGCPHTIDQCLIEDPQCDVAHNLARQVLKEVTEGS